MEVTKKPFRENWSEIHFVPSEKRHSLTTVLLNEYKKERQLGISFNEGMR